jgi:ATP-dependent Clp protease ATP-binding subunit ClpB
LLASCDDKGALGEILKNLSLTTRKIEKSIKKVRANKKTDEDEEGKDSSLKKFTIDLTERAELGKLDHINIQIS